MFYTEIYRDGRASEVSETCLLRGNGNKMYDWCGIDFNKQIARRVLGAKKWPSLRLTVEERMSWTSYHYSTERHSQKRQLVKNCKIFILLFFLPIITKPGDTLARFANQPRLGLRPRRSRTVTVWAISFLLMVTNVARTRTWNILNDKCSKSRL